MGDTHPTVREAAVRAAACVISAALEAEHARYLDRVLRAYELPEGSRDDG